VKKIFPFLFLVVFVAPFWGMYFYLSFQQKSIKVAVQNQLEEGISINQMVKLTFSRSEIDKVLRWEHAKEFEYQGQMYDIIEVIEKGDSTQYLCWWDKAETASKEKIRKLITEEINKSKPGNQKSYKLSDYYKSIYVYFHFYDQNENLVFAKNKPFFAISYNGKKVTQPPFPPPQICF